MTDLEQVRAFWEENPLYSGESKFQIGSRNFFEEHRQIYIRDCFAGTFDTRFLPPPRFSGQGRKILDLGCGIGFWVAEFGMYGLHNLYAADLTNHALQLTRIRLEIYDLSAQLSQENAENLSFPDEMFDHINCQGVIHHTPDIEAAISEISRVLKPDGTAVISVYYRNIFLRLWPLVYWLGYLLSWLGGGLKGRGREQIFLERDVNEIVRLYDGIDNPLSKCYSRDKFVKLLSEHFEVTETYLHFFPARALPFSLPAPVHQWLDRKFGFMIYANCRKVCAD